MSDGGPVDPDDDISALRERVPGATIERLFDFQDALYARGWMVVFDWPQWDIGKPAFDDPAMIADFDLSTLRRELTTIGRADRFAEGTCESALARGVYAAIVRRVGRAPRQWRGALAASSRCRPLLGRHPQDTARLRAVFARCWLGSAGGGLRHCRWA
jgi:hypothetical protein